MNAAPTDPAPIEDAPHEPIGDGPGPRGPHQPDSIRILPGPAWIFAVLALARLAWGLREAGFESGIDPWRVGQVLLFETPSVVSVLLAAVLFVRHRDAPSRMRLLLVGMVVLAVVEGLRVLGTPLQPIFESLTPGDEVVTFLVPSALVYQVGINLLNAFAVAAMATGLTRARRFDDPSATWPVDAVLAGLVVLVAVTGIVSVSRLPAEQLPMTGTVVAYIVSTVVLNALSAAAFGYLAATTTAGARSGEEPRLAWRLGALGSWLVIGSLAALGVAGLVQTTPGTVALMDRVVLGIEAVFSLGFIGLLAGFALGLPALDPADDATETGAFGDETGASVPVEA